MLGDQQGTACPGQVRPSVVGMVSKACTCEKVGGRYPVHVKKKVIGGDVKALSDIVIGRDGCHFSCDEIDALINRQGLCSGMEVLKKCTAELNVIVCGANDNMGVKCESMWLFAVEYLTVGAGHEPGNV